MASPDHLAESHDAAGTASGSDRRRNERQIATFRTCCVVWQGEAHPAILRNMSDGGAMFEGLFTPEVGDIVTYWWDGIEEVEARVAWVKGTHVGVANLSGPVCQIEWPRPRATRVPVHLPVRVWTGAGPQRAELENISLSGIALHGVSGIEPGTLCTIELNGEAFHNCCVIRKEDAVLGIKFDKPLSPAKLMQLLDGNGSLAHVATGPTASRDAPQPAPTPTEGESEAESPCARKPAQPNVVRRFI
ncbi:hypothetical protein TMRO357_01493 [Alteriqipengyuania sp. 357]